MTNPDLTKDQFEARKAKNANIVRKNNAALYAGSPMFYYCRLCGAEMVLPESHIERAPRYCTDCVGEGRGAKISLNRQLFVYVEFDDQGNMLHPGEMQRQHKLRDA